MGLNKTLPERNKKVYTEEVIEDDQYIFTFGKYKDCSIEEVLLVNPKYVYWLHNAEGSFTLGFDLLDQVEEAVQNWDITDDEKGKTFWRCRNRR